MKKSYLLLVLLLLLSTNVLAAMQAYTLEVNVGPLFVEYYHQTNNGTIYGCATNLTVRDCMKQVYAHYVSQGATSIRFLYYLSGNGSPFQNDGTINPQWTKNLANAFADMKAAGIKNITPTPSYSNWGNGQEIQVYDSCLGKSATYRFYKASPVPFMISNDYPYQGTTDQQYNDSYKCAPVNPIFVGWSKVYQVLDQTISNAKSAGLNISEFDILNEINVQWFPVLARYIYDPTAPSSADANVYAKVRSLMSTYGFDSNRTTYSVIAGYSTQTGFDCTSSYGDSGRLGQLSALHAAIKGQPFGHAAGWSVSHGILCGGSSGGMATVPIAQAVPSIHDFHAYNCVYDATGNCDPTKDADVQADTTVLFNSMQTFLEARGNSQGIFMLGETFVGAKDSNGRLCENSAPASAPLQIQQAFVNSRLFTTPGRSPTVNFIRPWTNVNSTCEGVNVSLNPPFNPMINVAPAPTPAPTPLPGVLPSISNAGTGCSDNYCLWIIGNNVDSNPAIETYDGSTLLSSYSGSNISNVNYGTGQRAITLSLNASDRQVFGARALNVKLVNQTTGARSTAFQVIRPGTPTPTPTPIPTPAPPTILKPVIVNSGSGCDDNYCIWIIGDNLESQVAVQIFNSSTLIATYQGADLNYDQGKKVITFALRQGSLERQLFSTQSLGLQLKNMNSGGISSPQSVKRSVPY